MPLGGAIAIGVGSIAGGLFGSAGGKAQASAAKYAANLQMQLGEEQLGFNKDVFAKEQANIAPYLQSGYAGLANLSKLLATPGQGLLQPFTEQFNAPTAEQARATPGYSFLAGAGSGAIQNSAAAGGNLLSTGTVKSLLSYNQGLADTTYSEAYNRAFNEYQTRFNIFNTNQSNTFNRLAAQAGIGQTANTQLTSAGGSAVGSAAGTTASLGGQIGQDYATIGGANASSYAALGNAVTGGVGGAFNYLNAYNYLNPKNNSGTFSPMATGPGYGTPPIVPTDNPGGVG